jgi:DNA topoisomerase-3
VQLIVAEKPAVARDLARVLGVPARGAGAFRGARHVITWCIGHLVELDEPAAYDPAWRRWRLDALPMIPERFRLRPARGTAAQWRVVRDLLRAREFDEVVNACDAGREGELIFRYALELARAPARRVRRLWVSSLTDAALRAGLARLRPAAELDPLADAARCRSEADWLVGMNATRAVTVRAGGRGRLLSIGRVQTPTLALVVAREAAIRAFVPERYAEVVGTFTAAPGIDFAATWTSPVDGKTRLEPPVAAAIAERAGAAGSARVESVERTAEREPPPLLFDLTALQKTANKRFGLSAKRTLDAAQALYERHKALSYPRTDARHLPGDVRGELPGIFDALAGLAAVAPFVPAARAAAGGRLPRVFDDRKVGDHHAIIPTGRAPDPDRLGADERRVYDLVVRRFLAAFHPDAELEATTVTVAVPSAARAELPPPPDRFVARGKVRRVAGWQAVAGIDPPATALPALAAGQPLDGSYAVVDKQTEPPRRFTEATLLAAMESAGKEITDEELRLAMRDCGLGTPATRAQTIETLLERDYLRREGKALAPTALGVALVETLPVPSLASPELTGRWEARLARVARGEEGRAAFMADIAAYVRGFVAEIRAAAPPAATAAAPLLAAAPVGRCPRCRGDVVEKYKFFACAGCDFKLWKRIAGKAVSAALAAVLLGARRTRTLPGFRSKAGKRFAAALVLADDGQVRLDFDAAPARPPAAGAPAKAAAPTPTPAPSTGTAIGLICPRCRTGQLVLGRRAWGCARWAEGCRLVVPFEVAGRRVTPAQLKGLVEKGVTRKGKHGRLRLDLAAEPPQVRVEGP